MNVEIDRLKIRGFLTKFQIDEPYQFNSLIAVEQHGGVSIVDGVLNTREYILGRGFLLGDGRLETETLYNLRGAISAGGLFKVGEFTALLAIIAYAIVPMIRYTRHGLTTTPADLVEAAEATGATPMQMMIEVRAPYAAPTILLGLNQTILYGFAMLVIAALIGTTGLGQAIYIALGSADLGLGIAAGAAMALLALVADRLAQGFANRLREGLGLPA